MYKVEVDSAEETQFIASKLSEYLVPGSVITLEGDLGIGKTVFTQGIAKGLGIQQVVNSPTFTIIKEYIGKFPLYHMDVYRLDGDHEDLGFEEYFFGEGITVIEWASIIKEYLPEEYLKIKLEQIDGDQRRITFMPKGERYEKLCKEFFNHENFSD